MTVPISKQGAEHYSWGEECDGWHLLRSNDLSIIQEHVPPGAGEVCHFHQRAQQFFFVLSGEATLQIGEEHHSLQPGKGCHVPAGVAHQLSNEGPEPLEFLVVSAPMAQGDRVVVQSGTYQGAAADAGKRRD